MNTIWGIRSCTVPHCAHCGMAIPIRDPRVGDTIPDRRRGAHHTPTVITDGSNQQAGDGAAHLEALPDDADGVDQTQVSIRRVTCPRGFEVEAEKLRHPPLIQVPLSVAARFAATWTDSLEGCMAGDRDWGGLARYRCRLVRSHQDAIASRSASGGCAHGRTAVSRSCLIV